MSRRFLSQRFLKCTLVLFATAGVPAAIFVQDAPAQTAATKVHLDIPSQDLSAALTQFARETGTEIIFASDSVREKRTAPLKGEFERDQALKILLEGTGLKYRGTTQGAIVVERSKTIAETAPQGAFRLADSTEAAAVAGADSQAGENPAADSADTRNSRNADGLEEIVVTATKRAQSLQKLPQAVTAITSQRLDELNALSFQDYFRDVPGLMLNIDADGVFDFSIRGVSGFSTLIPQTTATVGQYIDEIPVTSTGAQIDMRLVDIDHIEVLRGPQGTYYGEGSLGGTVRIITKKPDLNRFLATAEGRLSDTSGGGTNHQESAMLNLPLWQNKLALRVNYVNARESGYIDSVSINNTISQTITGHLRNDINTNRVEGGRAVALFTPSDALSILAEVLTTKTENGEVSVYDPGNGDLLVGFVCPTVQPAPSRCYGSRNSRKADLYNLTVSLNLEGASLVSTSSWSDTRNDLEHYALLPGESADAPNQNTVGHAYAQELRLVSSPAWSDRWDYATGVYYARKRNDAVGIAHLGQTGVPTGGLDRDLALFGELGYQFTRHWAARLGVRESRMRQDMDIAIPHQDGVGPDAPITFEFVQRNLSYNPFTGRAVLNYVFNHDAMAYGSVSNGFRKGGPNLGGSADIPATYDPDKTTNYEIGWKIGFPTRRATFNGAIYHIDWKDVQTMALGQSSASGPAPNYYTNGGDVVMDGIELEGGLELLKGLQLRGSLTFIDARLAEDYVLSQSPLALHGKKGDRMPFVTPLSGSLSLNYRRPLGAMGFNGFAILNGQYQGSRHSDYNPDFQDPRAPSYAIMESYWTVGTQLGIENQHWRGALYVDNLLDERAQLLRAPIATPTPGHYNQITARPRTVGMFLRYSFE